MSFFDFLLFLFFMLISHFCVTAWIYVNVKREDKGLDPKPENFFSEHIFPAIAFVPFLLHSVYEYTFGFFSRLLMQRVCIKGVKAEDEVSRLRKENERLISERKSSNESWMHIAEVINETEGLKDSRFRITTHDDFLTWYYCCRKK